MENKINASNLTYASPDLGSQKSQGFSQDLNSPKFTRKRTDNQSFFSRRAEKRGEPEQKITFISPKKYLQHQLTGTSSYRSIAATSNIGQNFRPQDNIVTQKSCLAVQSTSNLADPKFNSYKFESAEQIRARVRASQENPDYKIKSEILDKKITELNDKIKCMKQQNSYLYKKIEDFNGVILEKNAIINQFSHLLKQKQQSIIANHSQIQFLRRRNQDLENSIISLSKAMQQNIKCSCTNTFDDTDDGQREKQNWQLEIEKYKTKVQQLASSFKYSQMQNSMYQKMRYDLENLISKNDTLKNQNKKLIARIEFLTDKQPISRNPLTQSKKRSQIEVDFELSPEK